MKGKRYLWKNKGKKLNIVSLRKQLKLIQNLYSQNTQRVPLIIREWLSLIANGLYYSLQTSKFNLNI